MPAALENVERAGDVGVHVGVGVGQRVAHTGLGGQVHHPVRGSIKGRIECRAVGQITPHQLEADLAIQPNDPGFLQGRVVVVVEVVEPHNLVAPVEQGGAHVCADEARSTRPGPLRQRRQHSVNHRPHAVALPGDGIAAAPSFGQLRRRPPQRLQPRRGVRHHQLHP